ncbi:MAG: allophanate hydrolase [Pseudarthrobacter sp.]|nr:allophanate hydrolase [Pseudarthrobacter sp.]
MKLTLPPLSVDPLVRVSQAYRNIEAAGRPEVWIRLRSEGEVAAEAEQLKRRFAGQETPALYGVLVAVKDNIDVAGLPTTAACPGYAYLPAANAPAVQRLVDAGAIIIGKTNLDQFATGLVGTRSPHGAVRNAHDASMVSGGSSSGSAVAVALGLVDAALGTDTAGSGRIPAAFNRLYSIKATLGYVPLDGVVPACPSYDCINVFARSLKLAGEVTAAAGRPADDPLAARILPSTYPLAARAVPTIAVASIDQLPELQESWRESYREAVAGIEAMGWQTRTVDITALTEAGELLYSGALVAERHASVGAFVEQGTSDLDPTVAHIIRHAADNSASDLARDQMKVAAYRRRSLSVLQGTDALLLPTAPFHPSIAEVAADPFGANNRLGVYTTFLNVLDMAAVAFPSPFDEKFGLSFIGRAHEDQALIDLTSRFAGVAAPARGLYPELEIGVFGAHMRGEPLNGQLQDLGAAYIRDITTDAAYRLLALPSDTAVTKVALTTTENGRPISGELWRLSPAALGTLLSSVAEPQSLGKIRLNDGTQVCAFLADSTQSAGARDISEFGGWRSFVSSALARH